MKTQSLFTHIAAIAAVCLSTAAMIFAWVAVLGQSENFTVAAALSAILAYIAWAAAFASWKGPK